MKEYFTFEGVAKRQEYWAMIILSVVLSIVVFVLAESQPVFLLLLVGVLWYNLATTVRRIRDTGMSMWWLVAFFVPTLNTVVGIVFGIIKSAEAE